MPMPIAAVHIRIGLTQCGLEMESPSRFVTRRQQSIDMRPHQWATERHSFRRMDIESGRIGIESGDFDIDIEKSYLNGLARSWLDEAWAYP